jgi:hypothetical protein
MTWWEAVLATLGVIGFWPALLVVGDRLDRWFQNRMTVKLGEGLDKLRAARRAAERGR